MAVQDLERIEKKLDLAVAGAVAVSDSIGGVMFTSMAEVMEFAKLLSLAGTAVPKHIRGNPGGALAVTIQALEWRMSPIAVANQSFEVNDKIAYMSQLIHAVVEARAPLKQRLRRRYEGETGKRKCIVIAHFKGEVDPVEYSSPEFDKITPKNSPLWKSDPDQQQWYYTVRGFARAFCPDVLLGIYSEDELERVGADTAQDVTPDRPSVGARLKNGNKGRGFSADGVDKALEHKPAAIVPAEAPKEPVPVAEVEIIPPDGQQLALAGDAETELETKKRAVENAETKADLKAIVQATTEYLREVKRPDLLSDFLSAAAAREKRLKD